MPLPTFCSEEDLKEEANLITKIHECFSRITSQSSNIDTQKVFVDDSKRQYEAANERLSEMEANRKKIILDLIKKRESLYKFYTDKITIKEEQDYTVQDVVERPERLDREVV